MDLAAAQHKNSNFVSSWVKYRIFGPWVRCGVHLKISCGFIGWKFFHRVWIGWFFRWTPRLTFSRRGCIRVSCHISFAAHVLGIFIVQLLKKCPVWGWAFFEQLDSSALFQARFTIMATLKDWVPSPIGLVAFQHIVTLLKTVKISCQFWAGAVCRGRGNWMSMRIIPVPSLSPLSTLWFWQPHGGGGGAGGDRDEQRPCIAASLSGSLSLFKS